MAHFIWCQGIFDDLLYPYKYNDNSKYSQWMLLKRIAEAKMKSIMNGVTDTTARAFAQLQQCRYT